MRKIRWVIGFLFIAAIVLWAVVALTTKSKTLADVTSPSGDWRIVVRGKQLLLRGIEVTAEVHTQDGRRVSLGVIDLRQEWAETEYDYQAHETLHTRIDEVKAVLGSMTTPRLLFRDDYFSDEDFFVSGKIGGEPVKMRIGKVDNLAFHFMSGLQSLDISRVSVGFLDLPNQLTAGKTFVVDENEFVVPGTMYHWHDSKNQQRMYGDTIGIFLFGWRLRRSLKTSSSATLSSLARIHR
jgi:hypothetical protein